MRKSKLLFFSMLLMAAFNIYAQDISNRETAPEVFFLKFDPRKESYPADRVVDVIREKLSLGEKDELKLIDEERVGENLHQRFQHYYGGVKVEYGLIIAHIRSGIITSMNGEHYVAEKIDISPKLNEAAALEAAKTQIGARTYAWESIEQETWLKKAMGDERATFFPQGELVIIRGVLAWKFDVYAITPEERLFIYIDALTGRTISKESRISDDTGTGITRYSGSQTINTFFDAATNNYQLKDYSRGQGIEIFNLNHSTTASPVITEFTDADNNWNWAVNDDAAIDGLWGAEKAYDYWLNIHQRNSYNGSGAKILTWIHYGTEAVSSWDGTRIRLGDNYNSNVLGAKTSLDIVAHELGHAIKDATCQLGSYYESGALNEGLSDIWGACAENYVNQTMGLSKNVWLFEEETYLTGGGAALRSLIDPKQFSNPDTYKGQYWYSGDYSYDKGGVHNNCTVLGHWFYILAAGEVGVNDNNFSYNVAGITIAKAEQIVFNAEKFYITSNAGYYAIRYATIDAAEDLYGVNAPEVQAVKNSWDAVGVVDIFQNQPAYCSPTAQIINANWITKLTLSTTLGEKFFYPPDSGLGVPNGYTNFMLSGGIVSLHKGQSYLLDITATSQSGTNYYKVWIDYNNNGSFEDPGELVLSEGPINSITQKVFSLSASASIGLTRMRVAFKTGSTPDSSCSILGEGEFEDFGINIQPACPQVDFTVAAITTTGAMLSVTGGSTGNYQILYGDTNGDPALWQTVNINAPALPVIALDPQTSYLAKVRAVCGVNNFSDYSQFKILSKPGVCLPNALTRQNTYSSRWINSVTIGGTSFNAGRAINFFGYQDFSRGTSVTGASGSMLPFTINPAPGGAGNTDPYYIRIWLDANHDGIFSNNNEVMFTSQAVVGTLQGSFTIPTCIPAGKGRIRVVLLDHPFTTACESYLDGETEDYAFVVSSPVTVSLSNDLADDALCTGSAIVPYTTGVSFNAGNVFTAKLSDANGSFVNAVTIGTKSATLSGSINVFIPFNTTPGINYKIRIVSSSPALNNCKDVPVIIGIGPNTISGGNGNFCAPAAQALITGNIPSFGGTGTYNYQWQISSDNNSWSDIASATLKDYTTPVLSQTTHYRRMVKSDGCTLSSNVISRIVIPALGNNFLNGSNYGFCGATNPPLLPGTIPLGGTGAYSYQWESSIDNVNWVSAPAPSTAKDYDPPLAISQTTYYRRKVSSGACTNLISNSVYVRIDQAITGNSIPNSGGNFCGPTDPGIITGSVPVGSVLFYQWQSSPGDGTPWIDIPGATGKDYDPPLTSTTLYLRRVVDAGACGTNASNYIGYIVSVPPPAQNIVASGPTTICTTGGSVTLSVTISYNPSTTYQWKKDGVNIVGATYSSLVVTGSASNAGSYSVAMTTCSTVNSNSVNVDMVACTAIGYCISRGQWTYYDWIDLAQIGTLTNVSGNDGGYGDYSDRTPPVLQQTLEYKLYVSASNTSQVGNKYWNVWIDYNQDGDFTDAGEQVMNLNSTSTGTLSSNITIPLNAILGNTRMRVAMKYGAASTSCESFTYGEVEDYTVSIADPNGAGARKKSSDTDQLSDPEQLTEEIASNTAAKVYPNPVADHLHITVSDKYKNGGLFITDALGRIVYKENYLDQKEWDLVTADWASGIYLITLQNGRLMTYQRFIKE